jgi:putative DNA primase/helicase
MRNAHTTPIAWPVDVALAYAAQGWAVFPCHTVLPNSGGCTCGDEHCATPAHHAVVDHGERFATTDEHMISLWWERWPRASVAIRSESHTFVVDVTPECWHCVQVA